METTVAMPTDNINTGLGTGNRWVCPDFKVFGIFSSHMVLQQNKPIRVWGFCARVGEVITGTFMGETVTAAVPADNKWVLVFSPRPYTREGPVMTITDGGHPDAPVVFDDVLIGDVWLIGGQSNAELTLAPCLSITPSVEFYEGDNFRLFTQTQAYPYTHQEMCEFPQPDVINPDWCWKRPDEEASKAFSAMGWYFAREVSKQIDVPLGMVMMCAGGACIRELIPEELAHMQGYTAGANVKEGGYYNTLIHPLEGLQFKAQMFFQGESEGLDRALAEKYDYELALLVADERARFGFEFPFYNVQLSSYRQEGSDIFYWLDIIRMKQFDAVRLIPESNLTVDMDLGAPDDYPDWPHSPRKMELGERLAKLALAREYGIGEEREVSSPWPAGASLSADKKTIYISFGNIASGLVACGHAPADSIGMDVAGFSVGDYDHRVPAHAVISGRGSVTVDVPEDAKDLSHVNYAYFKIVDNDNASLRGGNNLPCPAFSLKLD